MIKTYALKLTAGIAFSLCFANLSFAQTTRVGLHSSAGSCSGCDLSGKDLPGMMLRDANFSKSIFNRSNLSGGKIHNTDLSETYFRKAFLVRVEGTRVNLSESEMQDATLVEANFTESIFAKVDMQRADLAMGTFRTSIFDDADLINISAPSADFTGSRFMGASFDNANLQDANLSNTVLKNVNFGNARLRGASLEKADISGADFSNALGLIQAQLDLACGNPATLLPLGFSVPYCADAAVEMAKESHKHKKNIAKSDFAAKRLDRAVENLEHLMTNVPEATPEMRRNLQSIHSDLVSARREIEK